MYHDWGQPHRDGSTPDPTKKRDLIAPVHRAWLTREVPLMLRAMGDIADMAGMAREKN